MYVCMYMRAARIPAPTWEKEVSKFGNARAIGQTLPPDMLRPTIFRPLPVSVATARCGGPPILPPEGLKWKQLDRMRRVDEHVSRPALYSERFASRLEKSCSRAVLEFVRPISRLLRVKRALYSVCAAVLLSRFERR